MPSKKHSGSLEAVLERNYQREKLAQKELREGERATPQPRFTSGKLTEGRTWCPTCGQNAPNPTPQPCPGVWYCEEGENETTIEHCEGCPGCGSVPVRADVVDCENPDGSTTRAHLYPSVPVRALTEEVLTLIRLGLTDLAQRNVEMFARRLARRRPELAEEIRKLLPPMNPLRDRLTSPEESEE